MKQFIHQKSILLAFLCSATTITPHENAHHRGILKQTAIIIEKQYQQTQDLVEKFFKKPRALADKINLAAGPNLNVFGDLLEHANLTSQIVATQTVDIVYRLAGLLLIKEIAQALDEALPKDATINPTLVCNIALGLLRGVRAASNDGSAAVVNYVGSATLINDELLSAGAVLMGPALVKTVNTITAIVNRLLSTLIPFKLIAKGIDAISTFINDYLNAVERKLSCNIVNVTVWVPGTRLWPQGTLLEHAGTEPNLNKASGLPTSWRHRQIADILSCNDAQRFPFEHFYIFGWDGALDYAVRKDAARMLYEQLLQLVKRYRTTCHQEVCLTIITHSHGGNVALNLAAVDDDFKDKLYVNQLITIACPVQGATCALIHCKPFASAYVLYSPTDTVQTSDPQGLSAENHTNTLLSGRTFKPGKHLVQVAMSVSKGALQHEDFRRSKILSFVPELLNLIDQYQNLHGHCNYLSAHLVYATAASKGRIELCKK